MNKQTQKNIVEIKAQSLVREKKKLMPIIFLNNSITQILSTNMVATMKSYKK